MKKIIAFIILVSFFTCSVYAASVTYAPGKNPEYVFVELSPVLQEYGFFSFDTFSNKSCDYNKSVDLSYSKYVGKKFYVESVTNLDSSYDVYQIVIETNERVWIKRFKGSSDFNLGNARLLSDVNEFKRKITAKARISDFTNLTIVDGTISAYGADFDRYILSNGAEIYARGAENIDTIIEYAQITDITKREHVWDVLSRYIDNVGVKIDDFDEKIFLFIGTDSDVDMSGSEIKLITTYPPVEIYIGVQYGEIWLRFRAKYQGDDWIFAKSITMGAGKERWNSGDVSFERETLDQGEVLEIYDCSVDDSLFKFMRTFSSSSDARVRFRGDSKYADRTVSEELTKHQLSIYEIYDVLTE